MVKRPFLVTLTLGLVLILTAWNILRAWTSFAWQAVLIEYSAHLPPVLSGLVGIFWSMIGFLAARIIWQRNTRWVKWLIWAAAGYSIWFWAERLIWQSPRPNTVFAILVNLTCLLLMYLTTKLILREAYERDTEHPEIK